MLVSTIDLKESLSDTPNFRAQLLDYDVELTQLDSHLKALIRCLKESLEISELYGRKMETFSNLLDSTPDLLSDKTFRNSQEIGGSRRKSIEALGTVRKKVASSLREIEKSRTMLQLHLTDVFISPLEAIVKEDIPRLKDNKRQFEKLSDDHDNVLNKYMAKKENDVSIEENVQDFIKSRDEFRESSFAHAQGLKEFQMNIQIDLTENTLACMYALQTFYHQGYEILKDADPTLKEIAENVQQMRSFMKKDQEETNNLRGLMLQNPESDNKSETSSVDLFSSCQAGYLYLKSDQRIFESWTRYYFKIEDDTLFYFTRDKPYDPVGRIDIKLCTIKTASNVDRRFIFMLISNTRSYILQAESEEKAKNWVATLQRAIENALKFNRSELRTPAQNGLSYATSKAKSPSVVAHEINYLDQLRYLPGNESCADCKADAPTWACINLGILLCIECSGIHRSLGVQISKIRSLTLDNWEPTLVEIMLALGNRNVNKITEHEILHAPDIESLLLCAQTKIITANSTRAEKSNWINAKYVAKAFCEVPDYSQEELNKKLHSALEDQDYPQSLRWILQGADPAYGNTDRNSFTCFHSATEAGNLAQLEFILLWSSQINLADSRGRTPLHIAAQSSNPRLVWFLMQRGGDPEIKDSEGKLPVDYAIEIPDVSVVMAFRYFVFLKQSNPKLTQESSFGYDQALDLFGPQEP